METEIDVKAILKDKPQGVKLYSSIYLLFQVFGIPFAISH